MSVRNMIMAITVLTGGLGASTSAESTSAEAADPLILGYTEALDGAVQAGAKFDVDQLIRNLRDGATPEGIELADAITAMKALPGNSEKLNGLAKASLGLNVTFQNGSTINTQPDRKIQGDRPEPITYGRIRVDVFYPDSDPTVAAGSRIACTSRLDVAPNGDIVVESMKCGKRGPLEMLKVK